jgi:hypothetical protein
MCSSCKLTCPALCGISHQQTYISRAVCPKSTQANKQAGDACLQAGRQAGRHHCL